MNVILGCFLLCKEIDIFMLGNTCIVGVNYQTTCCIVMLYGAKFYSMKVWPMLRLKIHRTLHILSSIASVTTKTLQDNTNRKRQ